MSCHPGAARTAFLTALAMVAFAANSLLCRAALGERSIDAASFTAIRLAAGALALWLIVRSTVPARTAARIDWRAAFMLFVYAAAFSFAYLSLNAATGALVLFGAVQLTMFIAGLRGGEIFPPLAWAGLALAVAGFVYLVWPGLSAPPAGAAALMALAGVAWGVYSLRGRGVADPLGATAANFLYAVPLGLVVVAAFAPGVHVSTQGAVLALASGAVASGMGYVIWYAALGGLNATRAATVQLSVPAAAGGVTLLGEAMTLRLGVASAAILGGIALVVLQRATTPVPAAEASAASREV